jgi:hypothetical protein
VKNLTGSPIDLTGYALWDKDPRSSTDSKTGVTKVYDTPEYVFARGTKVPGGATLRVRSGAQPDVAGTLVAAGPTLLYTGKSARFSPSGDRIELAHLSKAPVDCTAWGGVSCAGQRPVSIPTQPVGVTAQATAGSVTIRWGAPISRGGSTITGYTATAYSSANPGAGAVLGTCSTDGTGRACSIPGAIGTRYYADVVARNAVGTSAPSAPRVQAAPRTVPGAPGAVTASRVSSGVLVSWGPAAENGAVITGYTASAYTTGTGGTPTASCTTSNGAMRACTITGLWPGREYFIEVTARNRAGTGSGNSPRAAAAAGAMSAVSTYSGGRVTVRWDAPEPGSAVTGYVATLHTKASGGKKVGECRASAGATSCRTKKMKKRSTYHISLTMLTPDGSYTVKPRITTGPPRKASTPKLTAASPLGKQVVIAWAPPASNGYSYLKGYGARLYSKSKGGKVRASCSADAATLTCTTKAVKQGSYYAAVRVKNSKGWSSWSKRVKVVVP